MSSSQPQPQTDPESPSQTNAGHRIPRRPLPNAVPEAQSSHHRVHHAANNRRRPDSLLVPPGSLYLPDAPIPRTTLPRPLAIYIPNESIPEINNLPPSDLPSPPSIPRPSSAQSSRAALDWADPPSPTPEDFSQDRPATPEEIPIPKIEQRPSFLKRAATATRKAVVGRTHEELKQKTAKEIAKALQEHAREVAAARASLRERTVRGESITHDELRELARLEGVYLTPPGNRHDLEDDLEKGIVARLARVSGGGDDGGYVFLGSNRGLYIGRDDLGRGARLISADEERLHYSEAREIARAYYTFCL